MVHPISAEDTGIGLIRFENKTLGQFEVSWTFRGGMDLRDEVAGTEGTIWLDHFLRTGFEMFTAVGQGGYVAEKAEGETGWLFPVGDEVHELGYIHMFADMFNALDDGQAPMETMFDGYVVNAIIDACYQSAASKKWESVVLERWTAGRTAQEGSGERTLIQPGHDLIKEEKMPDGRIKRILKDRQTGDIFENVVTDIP
jgi:hypothetical protein